MQYHKIGKLYILHTNICIPQLLGRDPSLHVPNPGPPSTTIFTFTKSGVQCPGVVCDLATPLHVCIPKLTCNGVSLQCWLLACIAVRKLKVDMGRQLVTRYLYSVGWGCGLLGIGVGAFPLNLSLCLHVKK